MIHFFMLSQFSLREKINEDDPDYLFFGLFVIKIAEMKVEKRFSLLHIKENWTYSWILKKKPRRKKNDFMKG